MSNGNGHRWSKFWWQDWQNDTCLRMCGLAAQGLWMRVLCLMHEATPVGHLLVNGEQPTPQEMSVIFGAPAKEVVKLLAELEARKVYSRTAEGVIYSRRMVKDAAATQAGREWGKAGGNPSLNGKEHTPKNPEGGLTPPLTQPITPSLIGSLNGGPNPKKLEADSEAESRERKEEDLKTLTLPLPTRDRAREQQPPEAVKPARTDRTNDAPPTADPLAAALIQRAADAIKMRVPYGEVRTWEEQAEAVLAPQTPQLSVDEAMGMKWQPAPAVRTLEQQIAAATAGATPEQVERARVAFAMRAGGYAAPPMAAAQ